MADSRPDAEEVQIEPGYMGVLCSILSTFLQVWNYLKIKVHTGFCFLFFAFASPLKNMHAPRPGIESKSHLWPRPQLQQCQILNLTQSQGLNLHLSSNLSHCRDNSGSLTSCVTVSTPIFFLNETNKYFEIKFMVTKRETMGRRDKLGVWD